MKKMTIVITLVILGFLLVAGSAAALTTSISPTSNLLAPAPGGILDQLYGLGNVTRIDDSLDQIWFYGGQVTTTGVAKYANLTEEFGYIPADSGNNFPSTDFVSLFSVSAGTNGTGLLGPAVTANPGGNFVWALRPSATLEWSSLNGNNSDGLDHMATWLISGSDASHPNNTVGNFVIAWENADGGGNRDFNDLVVEVGGKSGVTNPVPEPTTMLLFGAGLVGLAGFGRKKFKK